MLLHIAARCYELTGLGYIGRDNKSVRKGQIFAGVYNAQ
jgi:hypothetical protein